MVKQQRRLGGAPSELWSEDSPPLFLSVSFGQRVASGQDRPSPSFPLEVPVLLSAVALESLCRQRGNLQIFCESIVTVVVNEEAALALQLPLEAPISSIDSPY